ncbi:MAG: hypothetical protein L6Q95_04875 [Planctomycetes bacterium]|nr:hypothetical protein [Planctomycetota bacterium]
MKRFVVLAAVAVLVIGLPLAHDAVAAKNVKVTICHLNSSNTPAVYSYSYWESWYGYEYSVAYEQTYYLGNMIEVDESAIAAHVGHGDPGPALGYEWAPLDDYAAEYLTTLEDYNGYFEFDYRPDWDYYGWYEYDNVNAVIKNADCYGVIY